ncbi:MAG: glutamine-hydrolyzing carbamoyl-phosphate synthase small subunit [Spirochaetes bacterium]|uniref:Carbamoyl phosphate synthase small chain n=1 Tax=Candidatus Ornithospirochaeta stercoripullorum TaxID=2840899 RepID=A0A9D9H458_9SPIO|nr:glutamine-hydrolyzing carbamoyl-phosphate synthase small subunit [Candidatus Ornithospirochaeta stercoripullorum]
MERQAILKLKDGKEFTGIAFGADNPISIGEAVFNTGIPGYQEILTDPSYAGQIVTMTSPMIGNYGISSTDNQSSGIKATGLIVKKLYRGPVMEGRITLDEFMKREGITGIEGVDTRALTLHLRDHGSQNAVIFTPEKRTEAETLLASFPEITERDLIDGVSVKQAVTNPDLGPGFAKPPVNAKKHFAVIDYGIKRSIIASLYRHGASVTLFPHTVKKEEIIALSPSALFLSNGPGDPALLTDAVELTKSLIGELPIEGICLGHQIITIAIGGKTEKMKFGHHGSNQPVRDTLTGRTFVTAQNHGFMTVRSSLPATTAIWFENADDGTVEGLYDETLNVRSVQFHPEAAPGPEEGDAIFNVFMEKAR